MQTLLIAILAGAGFIVAYHTYGRWLARKLFRLDAAVETPSIQLNDDHWDTIRFMRDYYDEHQVIADARFVIKHLAERVGKDAQKKLFELYPYGYVKQACKIAGMRRPRAWSTG